MAHRVALGWFSIANSEHLDIGGFRVIYVKKGDKSPHRNVTAVKDALVEFYDLKQKHTPDGQFIADYYAETIMDGESGLNLHGGVDSWKVSASDMEKIREWIFKIETKI